MAKPQKTPAEVQAERFEEVRKQFTTREDFRASIEGENEKTLRASAKDFGINLQGRDNKNDILDTIATAIYPDNTNAPAGAESGDKPTPAHDEETDKASAEAAEKVAAGDDDKPSDGAVKANMDSTTESAEASPEGGEGMVIKTPSPQNPNERFTEPLEEKKAKLSHTAIDEANAAASEK